jgi:hypothetical protein
MRVDPIPRIAGGPRQIHILFGCEAIPLVIVEHRGCERMELLFGDGRTIHAKQLSVDPQDGRLPGYEVNVGGIP